MTYDKNKIKFQTYSWGYGTTSFRVSELKYKIEKQLILLKELQDKYPTKEWKELQFIYFEILVENDLAKSTSNNKEKDARQKTSSLKDLGLINEDRKLTNVGLELYQLNKKRDFKSQNIFYLREDAYIYFKQFLKINFSKYSNSRNYSEFNINPFLSLIYAILELKYLTLDEFIYRFPLCQNFDDIKNEIAIIKKNRNFELDSYLREKISKKENYKNALCYFIENNVTLDILSTIIFDRKSSKSTKIYFKLFNKLFKFYQDKKLLSLKEKQKIIEELKNILKGFGQSKLKPYLSKRLCLSDIKKFEKLDIFNTQTFKEEFFYLIHITKWHINLDEYYDLNKRFLNLTEIFIFENNKIYLDDIIKFYFEDNINNFLNIVINSKEEYQNQLYNNIDINIDENRLLDKIKNKFNIKDSINLREVIKNIKINYKIDRFEKLIKNEFDNKTLINILNDIKQRNDNKIKKAKDWDSDIPTIFEYIIGIIWYKISNKKIDPSNFLNLSLDNNLYPIRFASGGASDIIFEYDDEHLMIEVTLSNKDNQRKMELEPVSRHLGRYRLKGNNAYAIFIAPFLDPNVLVAFRAYANLPYYDTKDTTNFVKNLSIIPLSIDDIICMIKNNISYSNFLDLKQKFIASSQTDGYLWYRDIIHKELLCN